MIQLTRRGVLFERDAAWEAVTRSFAERHVVVLRQFVEEALLQRILRLVAKGEFHDHETRNRYRNSVLLRAMTSERPLALFRLFRMLLNSPVLFPAIQELVDCGADRFPEREDINERGGGVGRFQPGQLHHMMHEHGHFDDWHDDVVRGRQVGVSVNLEPSLAAAGAIEIRQAPSAVHREAPSAVHRVVAGCGDAVLIRIAKGLEHRALASTGAVPRCTFTGWYAATPNPYDGQSSPIPWRTWIERPKPASDPRKI